MFGRAIKPNRRVRKQCKRNRGYLDSCRATDLLKSKVWVGGKRSESGDRDSRLSLPSMLVSWVCRARAFARMKEREKTMTKVIQAIILVTWTKVIQEMKLVSRRLFLVEPSHAHVGLTVVLPRNKFWADHNRLVPTT